MALAQKQVKIVYSVVNKATGQSQKITKSIQKNFTKLTNSITTTQKAMGQVTKTTRVYQTTQKSMNQQISAGAKTLSKFGRRMVFTGFILGAVTRRIVRAFKGVIRVFAGVIQEGADYDKQLGWLGKTVEALALGGADLSEYMGDVMRVFGDSLGNAGALGQELADIDTHFMDIKNTIKEHTIPFLETFNDTLDELDWKSIKTGIGNAVDAFYDGLQPAFKDLADDVNLAKLMTSLETLGTAAGSFTGGFVDGIADMIETLSDIDLILGGDDAGIKGLAWWAGEATSKLALIAIPTIVIGTLISSVAAIVSVLGGIPTLITIAVVLATIKFFKDLAEFRINFEKWVKPILDALAAQSAAGVEEDSEFRFEGPTVPGGTTVGPYGELPPGFEDRLDDLSDLLGDTQPPMGDEDFIVEPTFPGGPFEGPTVPGGTGSAPIFPPDYIYEGPPGGWTTPPVTIPEGDHQWGGHINKTGIYQLHKGEYVQPVHGRGSDGGGNQPITVIVQNIVDGRKISETVSRHMGRGTRSTLILP